jgi:hypothetical protein
VSWKRKQNPNGRIGEWIFAMSSLGIVFGGHLFFQSENEFEDIEIFGLNYISHQAKFQCPI